MKSFSRFLFIGIFLAAGTAACTGGANTNSGGSNSPDAINSVQTPLPPLPPTDPKLEGLREQFAINYFKPEAHFALAKYYLENGNQVQAFYILENARKTRFTKEVFDNSYKAFFGDNFAEPSAEAKEAFETAGRLAEEKNFAEAEAYFLKAGELGAKSFLINAWIGRFYFKAKSDSARALPYYFKSYFLYPHAYETEFVESRIRNIASANGQARFAELKKNGSSIGEITRDADPVVVALAVEQVLKQWRPEYLPIMLECMSNDDSEVRWGALTAISKNAGASLDQTLSALMADKDARKRGLAAYPIAEHWPDRRFEILKKMLADPAELIRFDAISALMMNGGPTGVEMAKEHRKNERSQWLKDLIDNEGKKSEDPPFPK